MKKIGRGMICLLACILLVVEAGCGAQPCLHEQWDNGICAGCGIECRHKEWQDGTCTLCGMKCESHQWQDGRCVICGTECEHKSFSVDGDRSECDVCGYICTHIHMSENLGVCEICGGHCQHLQHDRDGKCVLCGSTVRHEYIAGVCECGKKVPYETDTLPYEIWEYFEGQGTLTDNVYETHDYTRGTFDGVYPTLYKHMTVYTPYGYDESQKYNVVLLLAGTDMNEKYYWIPQPYADNDSVEFKAMFDNMIRAGQCDPIIIVGINYFSGSGEYARGMGADATQLGNEVVKDVLPYIVKHYSTYASGGTREELIEARRHFGFIGGSYGAIEMYGSFGELFDVCSWFGGLSGGAVGGDIISMWIDDKPYDLDLLYMCAGERDFLLPQTMTEYEALDRYCEKCVPGVNMIYQTIDGAGHEAKVWGNGIYNCMLSFFAGV